MKQCTKCKNNKALSEFHRNRCNKSGYASWCRQCCSKHSKKYYHKYSEKVKKRVSTYQETNPEKVKKSQKKHFQQGGQLKRQHGPDAVELWDKFFVEQKGKCPGCERHQSELPQRLHLDHDHSTESYRGLLCKACNLRVGSLEKDIKILENLVRYLKGFYGKES